MGLIRIIFIFLIGYFIIRLIKRFLQPGSTNQHVHGQSKNNDTTKERNNIQDIDYEELD